MAMCRRLNVGLSPSRPRIERNVALGALGRMALTKTAARNLATRVEWTLLDSSFSPLLKDLTAGGLNPVK